MNLNHLQSIIAPIATPAAPAVVLGAQLYAGSIESGTPHALAVISAFASGTGMELSGALAFSMVLMAMRRKAWGPMTLGLLGVVAYAVFAIVGISQSPKGGAFATFVLMSLVAFLASGLYSYMQEARKDEAAQIELLHAETERIRAEKNRVNAEARRAKASSGVQPSIGHVDTVQAERVRQWYVSNPGQSARACARALGISPTTASRYKPVSEA